MTLKLREIFFLCIVPRVYVSARVLNACVESFDAGGCMQNDISNNDALGAAVEVQAWVTPDFDLLPVNIANGPSSTTSHNADSSAGYS